MRSTLKPASLLGRLRSGGEGGGTRLSVAAAVYVGGTIVQRAFSILLLPALTRVLSVEEFGTAGTCVALAALLGVLFGFGLSLTIARLYYDEPSAHRTTWAAMLRVQAVVSLLLCVAAFATGPLWAPQIGDLDWGMATGLAVGYGWLSGILGSVLGLLRAAKRPWAFAALTIMQVIVGGGAGLYLATIFDAAGYVGGMTLGALGATVVGVAITYRRPNWSRAPLGAGIRLSLPAMLHQLSTWGLDLADRVLVAALLTLEAVARYQIAYTAGAALMILITSAQMAWMPSYMSRSVEARMRLPRLLLAPVTTMALAGTVALVLAMPAILSLLAPPSYHAPVVVLALVAAATLPRAAYFVVVVFLVDQKRTGRLATASGAGALVNVAVNLALLPSLGLIGAGIAYVISAAVMTMLLFLSADRLLPDGLGLKPIFALWVVGLGIVLAVAQIPDGWGWMPVRLAVLVATAVWLVHMARGVKLTLTVER